MSGRITKGVLFLFPWRHPNAVPLKIKKKHYIQKSTPWGNQRRHNKDFMKRDRSEEEADPKLKLQVVYVPLEKFRSIKFERRSADYLIVEISSLDRDKDKIIETFDKMIWRNLSKNMRQQIRDTLMAIPKPSVVLRTLKSVLDAASLGQYIALQAICNGRDTIFYQKTAWVQFQFGKELAPETIPMDHNVFKKKVLPLLSNKDVRRLEQSSIAFRKNIMNFDVWQDLFERDYWEIYNPEIFSPDFLQDPNWTDYTHIRMLDAVSDFKKSRPYYTKSTPPLWKLLYEYQQAPIFDALEYVGDPLKSDVSRTLYRGTILMWHKGHFHIELPGLKGRHANLRTIKYSNSHFGDWVRSTARGDVFLEGFEFNKSFVYVLLNVTDKKFFNLCSLDDPTGPPVFEDVTKITECGLVGDTGYYFAEEDPAYVMNFSWPANIKYRHILVDHKRGLRKIFEPHLRIIPCYSTPSETFLLYDTDAEQCNWYRLKSKGEPSIIDGALKFNPGESFLCTYSNRWLVYAPVHNTIVIVRAGVPGVAAELLLGLDNRFQIDDGCIVGDKLYIFQSGRWAIVVDLEKAYNREEMELESDDTYLAYPIKVKFACVQMTIFGPAVRTNEGDVLMFVIDKDKNIKLVSCQVCQVLVESMCSLCETPACSEKHLHCCGEK